MTAAMMVFVSEMENNDIYHNGNDNGNYFKGNGNNHGDIEMLIIM